MFKVTFAFENGSEVEAFANAGDNLLEVARGCERGKLMHHVPENGACGKCRVQLKGGELDSKKLFIFLMKNLKKDGVWHA